jgi:hypothetical protein
MNLIINQHKAKASMKLSNNSSDSTDDAGYGKPQKEQNNLKYSIFESLNGGLDQKEPGRGFLRNTTTGIMEISKAVVESIQNPDRDIHDHNSSISTILSNEDGIKTTGGHKNKLGYTNDVKLFQQRSSKHMEKLS